MTDHSVFVNELSALTGLDKGVLTEWANLENGVNNNILGVTSGGVLKTYSSQTAAAQDTAALLKSSPNYKNIIASTSGSPAQQALAIAQSPWRLGPTGLKNQGGTDPYYLKGFIGAGILTGSAGTTPPPTTTGGSSSGSSSNLATQLVNAVFGGWIGQKTWQQAANDAVNSGSITVPNYSLLSDALSKAGIDPNSTINASDLTKVTTAAGGVNTGLQTLQNLIPDVPTAITFVGVIIIAIAFIGLGGLVMLKGGNS